GPLSAGMQRGGPQAAPMERRSPVADQAASAAPAVLRRAISARPPRAPKSSIPAAGSGTGAVAEASTMLVAVPRGLFGSVTEVPCHWVAKEVKVSGPSEP